MQIFETCQSINNAILADEHVAARDQLIGLLDYHKENEIEYSPLVNHLIRETGLYPYMETDTASWQDRFVYEAFKVDVGGKMVTLHREQSILLAAMIDGDDIAVSAPTSFGKSFVIDAFIAIKKPDNVVIIVPTIALTDETRRRLYKKFSNEYKIITTSEVEPGEKNIFIFPQERANSYLNVLTSIDLLIVDEFYKASNLFDKERSPSLLKAIIKLGKMATQRYFLAPNIHAIKDNVFTQGMRFIEMLDFNTVFLEKHELYKTINNEQEKGQVLLSILAAKRTKSLIYAGTYTNIDKLTTLLIANKTVIDNPLLNSFADWLTIHYDANWSLVDLVRRGIGIHNGKLHRSLSQLQVRLFEEDNGFENIISTSSIIEGVNTSAENVILWRNRNGTYKLNDFIYKNIIGRGGRMFRHFVGKIYLLEPPPKEETTQLEIPFPDSILGDLDEQKYSSSLTSEQVAKIIHYKAEMSELLGDEAFKRLLAENVFQLSNSDLIKSIAYGMKSNPEEWNGFAFLNSDDPEKWERVLYKIIKLDASEWGAKYSQVVGFIKVISRNWQCSLPQLLKELDELDIGIDLFFSLERKVAFKFSAILHDVNVLQREILNSGVDVSPFISRVSHNFLPSAVYQLEEYGLPRMIAKKLHSSRVINFLDENLDLHSAIKKLQELGQEQVAETAALDKFDKYILRFFYDGITLDIPSNIAAA